MKNALIAFALVAILGWISPQGQSRQSAKPLTEADVVYLLKNYNPPADVAEEARKKGIDFSLTRQMERELREAGADDALINSLRELSTGTVLNPKDGQDYVYIPSGSFLMGCSSKDSECLDDEKPQHRVKLSKGFWMGQTAVTVEAWKRYRIAANKTALPTTDNVGRKNWNEADKGKMMPAVMMTWDEAKSFCAWASMRLPTEAEWEYNARRSLACNITASQHGATARFFRAHASCNQFQLLRTLAPSRCNNQFS